MFKKLFGIVAALFIGSIAVAADKDVCREAVTRMWVDNHSTSIIEFYDLQGDGIEDGAILSYTDPDGVETIVMVMHTSQAEALIMEYQAAGYTGYWVDCRNKENITNTSVKYEGSFCVFFIKCPQPYWVSIAELFDTDGFDSWDDYEIIESRKDSSDGWEIFLKNGSTYVITIYNPCTKTIVRSHMFTPCSDFANNIIIEE